MLIFNCSCLSNTNYIILQKSTANKILTDKNLLLKNHSAKLHITGNFGVKVNILFVPPGLYARFECFHSHACSTPDILFWDFRGLKMWCATYFVWENKLNVKNCLWAYTQGANTGFSKPCASSYLYVKHARKTMQRTKNREQHLFYTKVYDYVNFLYKF